MKKHDETTESTNSSDEVESWIFSLIPVGVAFAFYVVFIMRTELDNTGLFIAYGAAAGFIGLESYWITKGWKNGCKSTIAMGVIGIVLTLSALLLYQM